MLVVDSSGMCVHPKIKWARALGIEHGAMTSVRGIVVHQTDSPTAQSTLNKARCILEKRCTAIELKSLAKSSPRAEYKREIVKQVPDRFPANQDSIGIEIVGEALPKKASDSKRTYEVVSEAQNASLNWLVSTLATTLGVPLQEFFRHPTVSRKNDSEASTAKW